jgi:hypothetical protein
MAQQHCADQLFLLAELVDAASEYIRHCDRTLDPEEIPMVELAYDQISSLKSRTSRLGKSLEHLQERISDRLKQDQRESKRRAAN